MEKKFEIEGVKGDTIYIKGNAVDKIDAGQFFVLKVYKELTRELVQEIADGFKQICPDKQFIIVPGHIRLCVFKE